MKILIFGLGMLWGFILSKLAVLIANMPYNWKGDKMNWKVKKVGVDMYAVMEGNNIVASVYSTMETNKPFSYNANLIASAPELLGACKAIKKFCVFVDTNLRPGQGEGFRDAWHMVCQAISKAEGK